MMTMLGNKSYKSWYCQSESLLVSKRKMWRRRKKNGSTKMSENTHTHTREEKGVDERKKREGNKTSEEGHLGGHVGLISQHDDLRTRPSQTASSTKIPVRKEGGEDGRNT